LFKMRNFIVRLCGILILTMVNYSCNSEKKEPEIDNTHLFKKLSPNDTGIDFMNTIKNTEDYNIFKYRNFYNGGGVGIGDINNDGLPDVYMTSNFGENKLYLNKGEFKFEDITENAGVKGTKDWSTGVVFVDINNDGLLDIYVCNAGSINEKNRNNELFINQGNLKFTEEAEKYGLADNGFSTHAAFFDYDLDGDLDMYLLNNSFIPVSSLGMINKRHIREGDWDIDPIYKGGGDKLFQNNNGKFEDVSEKAGIYGSLIGFGLGVTVGYINDDNLLDIYVCNDFYERDYLYINQGNGTFKESVKDYMQHISLSSMGADLADINNDGTQDLFITDMLPDGLERIKKITQFDGYDVFKLKLDRDFYNQYMQNVLQLNNGNNSFSEIAYYSGLANTDWSWSALIFDMDNDGFKDIFVTNGIYYDLTDLDFMNFFANDLIQEMVLTGKKEKVDDIVNKMPSIPIENYAYRNNHNLTFENKTKDWGFGTPSFSNGSAYGDLDNDGDLDLIVNNVNQESFVYKNNTSETLKTNYLKIKLELPDQNRFAIGSSVTLYASGNIFRQDVIPTRGFQSSVDYVLNFGLGDLKKVDSIHILWPNQKEQILKQIEINQTLNVAYNNNFKRPNVKETKKMFAEVKNTFLPHKENNFSDFNQEGLITEKLSQEGPSLSIADINNDGYQDIFIGGAKGQSGTIYFQNKNGDFVKTIQPELEKDQNLEDTASQFFDANNDGHMDLLVGTGGNEKNDENNYSNRLYLNNGKGYFIQKKVLPSTLHNVSTIASYDFDDDGDIDVFVGSRSVPGIYGVNPKHLLLENDGQGNFKDVTSQKAFELKDAGMVTSAVWSDVDGNGKKDLVIVGSWSAPMIFSNNGRRLTKINTSLDNLTGLWNVIEAYDIDKDGDEDFILGNQGTNIPYKTTSENPTKLWINDFDSNGSIEQIITQNINGKDFPIHMKIEIATQLVTLKKENLKASDYAKKSMDLLFDINILNNSIVKDIRQLESIIVINNGNNNFEVKMLPMQVQFSSVNSIICDDINQDGNVDIILAGNSFEHKPQYGRQDANYGSVLLGDVEGNFSWVPNLTSGFFLKGEVKDMKILKNIKGELFYLIARNDDSPILYKKN